MFLLFKPYYKPIYHSLQLSTNQFDITHYMSELSESSQSIVRKIQSILKTTQALFKASKQIILFKLPQLIKDLVTAILAIKDLIPPLIYKTLFIVASISILYRKLKRWTKRQPKQIHKPQELQNRQITNNLDSLGAEYLVPSDSHKSVGNAKTGYDSFIIELQQLKQPKSRQFRDIVFFDLLRSYKQAEQKEQQDQ